MDRVENTVGLQEAALAVVWPRKQAYAAISTPDLHASRSLRKISSPNHRAKSTRCPLTGNATPPLLCTSWVLQRYPFQSSMVFERHFFFLFFISKEKFSSSSVWKNFPCSKGNKFLKLDRVRNFVSRVVCFATDISKECKFLRS